MIEQTCPASKHLELTSRPGGGGAQLAAGHDSPDGAVRAPEELARAKGRGLGA